MTVYESYEKFEIKKHYCGMTGIMSSGNLLYFTQTWRTQTNVHLKDGGDGGVSVVLLREEKDEKSNELHFCYSFLWKYYYVKVNCLSFT